ncbi:hypothetical protein F5888DRAFT_1808828 [Russula emetica]|nr:hypothetical protein F5888DRAFT_1808828 [Russula emetica]
MSMTKNNYDGSHGNNLPDNAWRKLPKMGKKTFDGWPVRDSEGHVFQRTSTSIDEAWHPRDLDEDKEGYTAAPQNTDDRTSRLISPVTSQTSNSEASDAIGILRTPSTATSSSSYYYYHGHPNNPATFSMTSSPLSRSSSSAPFSPLQERLYVHPIEWTVEETVNWLRSKGFEDTVCEKFIEQETTGDALLNLNATSLKTEIGIDAYGRRFRIANAIDDLRRVASVRFPSVKPTWSRSSSQAAQQRSGLKPLLLRSSSVAGPMSPSAQPDSGHLPKTPILSPCREPDPNVLEIMQKPTKSDAKTEAQGRISPSYSPRSGQGKRVPGRSLKLLSYRSDGALGVSAKRAAINREGGKRGNAVQADRDTVQLATQRDDPRSDCESSSSSTVKMSLSPSTEIATPLPQITQLKRRNQSMREWRKGRLDALYETSSTSTLAGTAGLIPKSRQHSPGIGSVSPLSINADTGNRKKDKNEKYESSSSAGLEGKNPLPLRRSVSLGANASLSASTEANTHTLVDTVLVQIGTPDHEGWIRKKGGHFSTWKSRYLVLKGAHLYWLRTDSSMKSKVEGHVNVAGYRVVPDDTIGSYGFKLLRGSDRVHYFSSDDQMFIREWIKALRKPSIKRDYMKAIVPSVDVPLVTLEIARAMNPRPPSPTTAAATQRNQRRENLKQLSTRGGVALTKMQSMPLFHGQKDKTSSLSRADSISSGLTTKAVFPLSPSAESKAPVRPPRDARRKGAQLEHKFAEQGLIKWASGHLPGTPINHRMSNYNGLDLLRIAESIKDIRGSCAPKSMFSQGPDHETLEGLFALVDFLLGEDDSGAVNINEVLQSKHEKVFQLLRALRAWEGHRAVLQPIGMNAPQGGLSMSPSRGCDESADGE